MCVSTHTRPSTPMARPGGHSQRKEPSELMQRPFMQMPGVWHSSMSGEEIRQVQLEVHLRQVRRLPARERS